MSAAKFNFIPRLLLSYRRLRAAAALCLLAGVAGAQDFSISTLTGNNAVVVDVNALVGDDRGGIAVNGSQVFLTGDAATARFNRDTLGGGTSLGVVRDGLVANLATSTVYLLGNASSNALPSGGGTFATLIELNGSTGVPSGNVIALSTPVTLTGSSSSVGIFSGWNRVVVHTGARVYSVSLPAGTVTDLGAMGVPTRTASESWAYWGVAENVGATTRLVYVRNSTTISRTTVPSGPTTTVATFANLNDMASFTVSVAQNRWYFHHESSSQFGAFSESLGYADATFVSAPVAPTIAVQPSAVSVIAGESASFSVSASGTGPLAYQWYKGVSAITDATNTSYAIAAATLGDAGSYSVVITNASGSVTSSAVTLTVSAIDADLFKILRLTASNAVVIDPLNFAGDDRGGLVATDQKIYLRGDDSVGSFNLNNLTGGIRLGTNFGALTNFFFYDSLVSDLRSQKAYVLGGGGTNIIGIFGGTVSNLVELHGSNGVPTGMTITLSTPIVMPGTGLYNANVGIFSGWGRIVLHNGTRAYSINTANGTVTDLGAMTFPTHVNSESWASWGVAEYFGGSHYIVYARDAQSIVRTRIPDGATTVISTFSNLADLANFTVVPGLSRWYFHNETVNQFTNYANFGGEVLGYADAAFLYQAPQATIVSQPQSLTVTVGASATFSVSATAVAALSYQWKTNGVAIAGATGPSVTFANAQLADSGLVFSVTVLDGGPPIDSANATLTVLPNAAPTLVVPANVTVNEDAGSQTNLVTIISAGAAHESGQTLTVNATSGNPVLTGPITVTYAAGTATLRYTNVANAFGSATITVTVTDNGGVTSGGVDSTAVNYLLTVNPVNDAPSATRATNNVVVLEDVGSTGVAGFLSAISAGPLEAQLLSLSVANNNNPLFLVQPALNLVTGDLTFTPAPDAFGSATVTYILSDDGGTALGGVDASTNTFTITVTGVNDAPTLALGVTTVNVLTNAGAVTTNIAPVATVGSAAETNSQTIVGYVASNDNNALFSVQPTLGLNGNLNFTVAGNVVGTANVSVRAQDSGDNLNGGTNLSPVVTVVINVSGPNQAPTFTLATNNLVVAEDSGSSSIIAFLFGLSAGEVTQSVTNLTTSNNNSNLFSAQPVFTGSGATRTLTFTPAANANGSATVTVSATDDGSSPATGTQTFTITVTPVNDAPSFALPPAPAPPGVTWTALSSGAQQWSRIAASADGTKLAAIFAGGLIHTSTDSGATWTAQSNSGSRNWNSIASSADGTKLAAVVNGGGIYTSTDSGVTWTLQTGVSTSLGWGYIGSSPDGMRLIASGYFIPAVASTDGGVTWFQVQTARQWGPITIAADGLKVSMVETGGPIWTSLDFGTNWFTGTGTAGNLNPLAASADGTKLVTAASQFGTLYTSTNSGTNWTSRESVRTWIALASSADGSFLVAAVQNGLIYTSSDSGVTWTAQPGAGSRNWSSLAISADGSRIFATDTAAGGFIYTSTGSSGIYNLTVAEDSGANTTASFATSISVGPANESAQTVTFMVTNDNNALFSSQPAIAANGTLTFTPAANAFGLANLGIILVDNGGAPGVSNSVAQTFSIAITNVNDAPAITFATNNLVVLEDAGAQSSAAFLSLSPGPFSEPGTVTLISVANNNNALFSSQPAFTGSTLTFTPAADANGSATVTVIAQDDTGLFSTNSFTLTVLPVNDMPTLSLTNLVITVLTNSGGFSGQLGATINFGAVNETNQAPASFLITNNNNALFTTQPSANQAGFLSFSIAPNQVGTATLFVRVQDTGGTANGGVDVSAPPVLVTVNVTPGNSAPSFTLATNALAVLEDSGSFSGGGFLSALSPGSQGFELGQVVTVTTANNNSNLFSGQPVISGGTLSFTPAANANGVATVTVTATDNGTPALSSSQTVTITVTAVNDAPSFALNGGLTGWTTKAPMLSGGVNAAAGGVINGVWYVAGGGPPGGSTTNGLQAYDPVVNTWTTRTPAGVSRGAAAAGVIANKLYVAGGAISLDYNTPTLALEIYDPVTDSWTGGAAMSVPRGGAASAVIGGKLYVAGGQGGFPYHAVSALEIYDPISNTWTSGAPLPTAVGNAVGAAINGKFYVAGGTTGPANVALLQIYDPVSNTWTSGTPLSGPRGYASGGVIDGKLVVVGGLNASNTLTPTVEVYDPVSDTWTTGTPEPLPRSFAVAAVINSKLHVAGGSSTDTLEVYAPAVTVVEDTGPQSVSLFVTNILAGPANESAQTVAFITSNTASNLFAAQPSIVGSGASRSLSFTPAANANGTATVLVYAQDNGGTSPGVDTTAVQTFTITITPVNDPPTVTLATNLVAVLEDSGPYGAGGFATFTLPVGESGSVTNVLVSNNNSNLFAVQPSVSLGGTLTFTPAANANGSAVVTVQAQDDGGSQNLSAPQTFTITVTAVNDAPVFALSTSVVPLLEDAGAQTIAGFATNILGGLSADEALQNVTFLVSNDSSNKFSALPAINGAGVLTFTLAPNANGVITVAVVAQDNAGTANGGVNTSAPQFFGIVVTPVNDAPSVSYATNNVVVLEDSGPVGFPGFATFFLPADEAGQTVTNVAVANNNNALFAVQPSIGLDGTLTFVPAANAFSSAVVSVVATDNGGTDNGGQNTSAVSTFTITVTAVNDAPTFNMAVNPVGVLEDSGAATVPNVLTNISAGPGGESQSVAFITSNSASNLFTSIGQPVIGAGGTLTFTPAPNANGVAFVTIVAQDTGGTNNGGIDTSGQQGLTILITNINDAPIVSFATNNLVRLEDSGPYSAPGFASFSAPADELAQVLVGYTVSNNSNSLFSVQPSLALDGTLTFVPAVNAFGVATVTVIAQDNGGTANGGVDRSTNTFTLTLTGVNDAPTLALPFSYVYVETNSGGFHTNLAPVTSTGPGETGQFIQDFITTNNQPSFFTVQPYILPNGDLDFTLANGVSGIVTLTVRAHDSGGTNNGGVDLSAPVTFTIFVGVFNVAPSFTFGTNNVTVLEDSGAQIFAGQVANTSAGETGLGQVVSFTTGNNNNPLFSVQPSIAANGTLTFTPATNAFGAATVTVIATDDGLPALSTTNTFTITVTPVNDAPSFGIPAGVAAPTASPGGETWTAQAGSGTDYWQSIASSADGTKLAAVSGLGKIHTSTDSGVTWTARLTDANRNWRGIASSTDGTKLAAVNYNGQIYTSTDSGATWTARETTRYWWAIASSADGSKLVAANFNAGSGGYLYTSTDSGATWTERLNDFGRPWRGVASSADGTKLVAVAENSQVYTSTDSGVTWTARDSNRNWQGVASSADGTKLVAFVLAGQLYTSADSGVTWTARDSNRNWTSVASSSDGSLLLASVNNGNLYTSADSGVTWTARDSTRTWQCVASSADGSKLAAGVYNGQIYTSAGAGGSGGGAVGETWTPRDSVRNWARVASSADGTKLIAATWGGQLYTSTDSGVTWTARESNRQWFYVASSADGTKLLASQGGGPQGYLYTSTDSGVTWTERLTDATRSWAGLASSADGTKLVAVVVGGQIYTSTDSGVTWTPRDIARSWTSVASSADGTKLAAAVGGGLIYTSTDSGVTWVAQPGSGSHGWYDIASSADGTRLIAADFNFSAGYIYTSADSGVTWTARLTDTGRAWRTVASSADGSVLLAAGINTQIYVSTDAGSTWTARDSVRGLWDGLAVSADGSKLVAAAYNDRIYTSTGGGGGGGSAAYTLSVLEDSGAQTVSLFATNILAGPANESGQALSFIVTNNNPARFDVQPAIDASGTLTFTPGTNRNGSAVVTVYLQDNGGTNNGGVDLAGPLTFTISLTPVNDLPTIAFATNNVVVLEDSGAFSGSFATFATPPSNEGGQSITNVVTSNNSSNLFSVQPAINTAGVLTFTPAANAFGSATVTVIAQDSGGTANGGVDLATNTFTITITPVNDAPSFALLAEPVVVAGETWTARESSRIWLSVASSADGTKLTAAAYGDQLYTSGDSGVTWTARDSYRDWVSVASSADGSKLVAAAFNDQLYNSGDSGVTWTARDSVRMWQSVASSTDGTKLVAGALGDQLFTSTDSGVTWTARDSSRNWKSVASSADGSKLAAAVYGGQLFTSTDSGVTWTARDSVRSWHSVASSADGSKLVAVVFGGQIYTSTDSGVTWTARESNRDWIAVTSSSDGSKLVAVVYGGQLYTSTDSGVTWTARDSIRNWHSAATSADGSKLVAAAHGGQLYTSVGSGGSSTLTVLEDAGPQTTLLFATNIVAGPANESAQVVTFVVTNDNSALFSSQPAIGTNGTLTFTPALNAIGSATVTVYAQDDGGILNGGVDIAGPQTFTITVTPVNDPPSAIFAFNPLEVMKNSSPTNIAGFANFSRGPADESGQSITNVIVSNNNPSLFEAGSQPAISLAGTLTFKPEAGAVGEATVTVITEDNGGTANGGVNRGTNTFVIRVVSAKIYVENTVPVAAGNSVTVPVSIIADGDENGVGFTLNFNPAVLTFTGITAESGLTLVSNSSQATNGLLGVVLSKPTDNTFSAGYNPMVYVTFTVATTATNGLTPITFSSAVVYQQVTDKNANNIPYVAYTAGRVLTLGAVTGLEGDVTPRPTGNGSVTVSDAVQIGRFAAGLDTITNFGAGSEFQRADAAPLGTQGDGRVTVADWVQTLRFAAGLDTPGAAGGPTVQAVGLRTTALAAGNRTVRVVGGNLVAGPANTVSVQLDAQGNEAGLSLSLAFDASALSFVSATVGNGASGGSLMVNSVKAAAGKIGLVLVMPAGSGIAAGTRDIVTLTFNVTGSGATAISVTGDSPVAREVADVNANVLGASFVSGTFNIILPAGLKAAGVERAADGSLRLVVRNSDGTPVTAAQAAKYEVHVTSNLGGAWTVLPNALAVENGALKIVDPAANSAGLRLYKLVETP